MGNDLFKSEYSFFDDDPDQSNDFNFNEEVNEEYSKEWGADLVYTDYITLSYNQ